MKNLLFLFFWVMATMGYSQEDTYQNYKEILRKDPYFITHIKATQKDAHNVIHNYYGNLKEINAWKSANPMDLKGLDFDNYRTAYIEYCKKAGMLHAEESYDLFMTIAQTQKSLREKHKFLEKMPIAELSALFNDIEQTYPEFKIDPVEFVLNPKE
jgi:hypothetical protein